MLPRSFVTLGCRSSNVSCSTSNVCSIAVEVVSARRRRCPSFFLGNLDVLQTSDPIARARIERRRELTQQGFGPLYKRMHQIMLKHNPAGLDLTRRDARDDYELPVGTLIPKLEAAGTSETCAHTLFAEMQHWYRESAGTLEQSTAIADEIWQAWIEFQRARFSN